MGRLDGEAPWIAVKKSRIESAKVPSKRITLERLLTDALLPVAGQMSNVGKGRGAVLGLSQGTTTPLG